MAVFGIMTLNVIIHSIKTTQKDIQDLKIRKIKIEQFHFFVCTVQNSVYRIYVSIENIWKYIHLLIIIPAEGSETDMTGFQIYDHGKKNNFVEKWLPENITKTTCR